MTYTHRMVNGKRVPLTGEEIAELEARDATWAVEQSAKKAELRKATIDDIISVLAPEQKAQLEGILTQ